MAPEAPPVDPAAPLTPEEQAAEDDVRAQVADWDWLDELRNAGQLEAYRGEILFVAGKQILSHSPHMGIGWALAEAEADLRGIRRSRVSKYLVPGYEQV